MGKKPSCEELENEIILLKSEVSRLRESEEHYRLMADNISDTIWQIDLNTMKFTYVNPSYNHISGFSDQEIKNSRLDELFTPKSFIMITEALTEELTAEKSGRAKPRLLALQHYHKNGSFFWAEISARFVRDEEGHPYAIAGVTRDITKRKKAEKKLEEKTINLEEANTALKVLLKKRAEDRAELEERILANVNKLIIPAIDTLKGTKIDDRQATWIEILETNLRDIVSPFSHGLSSKYWRLTPMEFQMANLIKSGKTTKEIAELLHVATSTINTYRDSIRKKLGINNRKVNLKTYLSDLE
jgi:PAS domain S-box-containing protein